MSDNERNEFVTSSSLWKERLSPEALQAIVGGGARKVVQLQDAVNPPNNSPDCITCGLMGSP
jgi:hypothetical protein